MLKSRGVGKGWEMGYQKVNKDFKYKAIIDRSSASVAADLGIIVFNILPRFTHYPLKINSFSAPDRIAHFENGGFCRGKSVGETLLGSFRMEWPFLCFSRGKLFS